MGYLPTTLQQQRILALLNVLSAIARRLIALVEPMLATE